MLTALASSACAAALIAGPARVRATRFPEWAVVSHDRSAAALSTRLTLRLLGSNLVSRLDAPSIG